MQHPRLIDVYLPGSMPASAIPEIHVRLRGAELERAVEEAERRAREEAERKEMEEAAAAAARAAQEETERRAGEEAERKQREDAAAAAAALAAQEEAERRAREEAEQKEQERAAAVAASAAQEEAVQRAKIEAERTQREEALGPGYMSVVGFNIPVAQMPEGSNEVDWEALVAQVQRSLGKEMPNCSRQHALRLLMGCNLDTKVALERGFDVAAWRRKCHIDLVREMFQAQLQAPSPMCLPMQEEVCKLVVVNPCCLVTKDGCPVSIWHVGTANASGASKVADSCLSTWSGAVFEYADLWISELAERTGVLAGHVQIFNLAGLSLWQVTNTALLDKLKTALGAGQFYVENVSKIYVVNAASLFSMAYKLVQGLMTPRTASKIKVERDVPEDLLALLGPESSQRLMALIKKQQPTSEVARPP
mmetsp:Transcript_64472/g.201881  ORF Transcript_64472/g.201881 Transcript_64472/m.201881 type:complete len:421 (-) Transcript_64472:22-1284(-)